MTQDARPTIGSVFSAKLPALILPALILPALALPVLGLIGPVPQVTGDVDELASDLELLAATGSLPGMSAAIVSEGQVVWSQGFGYADIENDILAEPETRYRIASCSKPMAAVLVMQLVEQGEISLDTPMSEFWVPQWFSPHPVRYEEQPILLRHVMSHTSEGAPGESYSYSGNIFADVTFVLEQVSGRSYPALLQERIFDKAGMQRSSPGHVAPGETRLVEIAKSYVWDGQENVHVPFRIMDPDPDLDLESFGQVLAMPAEATAQRKTRLGENYTHLNAACSSSGVVSTVIDLAKFDAALDTNLLLSEESRTTMWTAAKNSEGTVLPYAIGWFVQQVEGAEVLWHYGWLPPTVSALYIRIPEKRLSFFLLSNSDRLSANLAWSQAGVLASPYARAFLDEFLGD